MLELLSEHACFGGVQRFYRHPSREIGLPMRFSAFIPNTLPGAAAADGIKMPALFYLSGLTCTEETFPIKAGAQRVAAELGLVLISPDTSPRGARVPGENDAWDFGTGAGFYIDATEVPWNQHYRMYSYMRELRTLVTQQLPVDGDKLGIFGHSMGGHGALMLALRRPDVFRSVSAFAPIAAPSRAPWGKKAFGGYLGADTASWEKYDASILMAAAQSPFPNGILIDQGLNDQFLEEQLYPDVFEEACRSANQPLTLRRHAHYDHNYYFIETFMEDHLRFHARNLK
jgi:S-formylglutathione hydrolase